MFKTRGAWPIFVLTLAVALSFSVPKAGAVTIAELLAQIQALQAQLVALQAAQTGGTAATACTFTRSLYLGVSDPQVKCLQQYLNGAGYTLALSGAGSAGSETNYYGSLTKAAVAKWQAANSVSPAVGYFGPISQAKYTALGGGAVTTTTGGTVVVAPAAGGLSVSLSAATPAARTIVAGAAMMPFGKWVFTAGSGNVTVTGLKFIRGGISSDAELGSAYLYDADSGDYIGQYTGLGSGILSFANSSGLFTINAGVTKNIELRLDVSSSASNNHTMSWSLNAATDVTSNATSVSGVFPSTCNAMTFVTVSNPSIATLTATTVATGNSVNAGTTGYLAGSFTLAAANSAVLLDRIVLTQNGSIISATDVTNIKLVTTGGTQIGSTLANLKSDGTGVFVMPTAYEIPAGQTIQVNVYADVIAGVNRTMIFNVLNLRDVLARDKTYNVGVNPSASVTMTTTTVQKGTLTITLDPTSPTGSIAPGQTGLTVAKFKVTSYGEQIKVLYVPFRIYMTPVATVLKDFTDEIDNIYLVDDAGNQIGTTITAPDDTSATNGYWDDSDSVAATFGTSSATLNYLIPANTTRIWSLKLDLLSTADGTGLTANLQAGTNNYQGQISLDSTGDTTAVTANALTITSNPFQAKQNSSYGAGNLIKGQSSAHIGSWVLSASSAEGITISTITLTSSSTFPFANLVVKVNGVQFGDITGSVAASTNYTVAGTAPITIPTGGSVTVDAYVDILSTATNLGSAYYVKLYNASAVGATTATTQTLKTTGGTAVSSSNILAERYTVNETGGILSINNDVSSPAAYQGVMGKKNQTVGIWRLTANNVSAINITDIVVTNIATSTADPTNAMSNFENLQWYKGGVALGPIVVSPTASSLGVVNSGVTSGYTYTFHFTTPVEVPQNSGISLELRGDIAGFASGGSQSNSSNYFRIENPGDVTALSKSGSLAVTISGPDGPLAGGSGATDVSAITVVRTKLAVTSDLTGITTTGHPASSADVMAYWVFTADPANDVTISTVTMKLSGSTLATIYVKLIDSDTGTAWGSTATGLGNQTIGFAYHISGAAGTASTSIVFHPNYTLTAGATKKIKVVADTTGSQSGLDFAITATTGTTNGTLMQWSIDNDTGSSNFYGTTTKALCWGDGTTACSTGGLNLEARLLPIYGPAIRY